MSYFTIYILQYIFVQYIYFTIFDIVYIIRYCNW